MNPPNPDESPLPELDDSPPMPPVTPPPYPTWVLPQDRRAYATDGTGIFFPLPPWPAQEARLWGRARDRDPRFRLAGCRPGPPRGAVRSPSPSKRGWRLPPPTTVGKKNQYRGRRPRNEEESKETCGVCLEPMWNNSMMFMPACKHTVHASCMSGVFEHAPTPDERNRCPTCRGWVWGYYVQPVPKGSRPHASG